MTFPTDGIEAPHRCREKTRNIRLRFVRNEREAADLLKTFFFFLSMENKYFVTPVTNTTLT